ncbi:hypothetical protein L596_024294 [Steinernema carpocapsae]|uniref:FAM86 N-terminal domain-containing protein n=1 Tax=Steinernema carpocapsae TaxID=34508 RepID=A0A4U5MGC7_STECR|nr:hypothetical protein L596_024294 [Steinernema carpocapsae]
MTSQVISLRQQLSTYTSRTSPTSSGCPRNPSLKLDGFPKEVAVFVRRYFAGAVLSSDQFEHFARFCRDKPEEASEIFATSLRHEYPLRRSYERRALKTLVGILESLNVEIPNEIFEAVGECMVDVTSTSHRIFFNDASDMVAIRESNEQLSHGTTGLSCWQASCHLANLLSLVDFSDKSVIELGAGCGLTGISLATWQRVNHVKLTDYDENVLAQLSHNRKLNFGDCSDRVTVESIDFMNFSLEKFAFKPDVIIGADIVYDGSILNGLSRTIFQLLSLKENSFCIIASALRNVDTLATFDRAIVNNGLTVVESARIQFNQVTFDKDCSMDLPQLFPFSASVDCPTVVYLIARKDSCK